jgi:integrase-like protein/Arm domain-containing DNA-binding protein
MDTVRGRFDTVSRYRQSKPRQFCAHRESGVSRDEIIRHGGTRAKPRAKAFKLADGAGMYLLVKPDGKKYWRFDYRFQGKRKTLALGVYPEVSLKDARKKRDEAKFQLTEGNDPGHIRKIEKLTGAKSAENTFRFIAEELLDKMQREGRAKVTIDKTRWVFEFAYPYIGDRPINEISAPEVLAALRSVEARGRFETARRMRSSCGAVFRLAIATGRAERDPTIDLRGARLVRFYTVIESFVGTEQNPSESFMIADGVEFVLILWPRAGRSRHAKKA